MKMEFLQAINISQESKLRMIIFLEHQSVVNQISHAMNSHLKKNTGSVGMFHIKGFLTLSHIG